MSTCLGFNAVFTGEFIAALPADLTQILPANLTQFVYTIAEKAKFVASWKRTTTSFETIEFGIMYLVISKPAQPDCILHHPC